MWPAPLGDAALHGLAGDFVRLVQPESEADPAAHLIQFLIAFGNLVGRGPHFRAEDQLHFTNEFAVLVGESAKARKGTSWGPVRRLMKLARGNWEQECIHGGLSSGEGLIHAIRDELVEQKPVRKKGKIEGYEDVISDKGVEDKRALIHEGEFSSVLKVMAREGNTLSAILRNAWDGLDLRVMTRNSPLRASSPHVSLVGHITRQELLRRLDATEQANGFGNRFIWIAVQRSKSLPDGGHLADEQMFSMANSIASAVAHAEELGELTRDEEARALWYEVYDELSDGKPGLFGAMTARSEAHAMRFACLYAILDESKEVKRIHLEAALAVWKYAEESVAYIFGDALGDPTADVILAALRRTPAGLDRTAISRLFSGHRERGRIDAALGVLAARGLVESRREQTGGRDREVWFAVSDRNAKQASEAKNAP